MHSLHEMVYLAFMINKDGHCHYAQEHEECASTKVVFLGSL